jgi:hypothetical protein
MNRTTTKKITKELNNSIDNDKEFPHEPQESVINNILNYSKALSIRKTKSGKTFEIVLN